MESPSMPRALLAGVHHVEKVSWALAELEEGSDACRLQGGWSSGHVSGETGACLK